MRVFYRCLLGLILGVVTQEWLGCGEDSSVGDFESGPQLIVQPNSDDGVIELGYFEEKEFSIRIEDEDGRPMTHVPVSAGFIESAHNASLSPSTLETEGDGSGEITLTAPDREAEFDIRFYSPTIEQSILVSIAVIPSRFSLNIDLIYKGSRTFSDFKAELYEELECSELKGEADFIPVDRIKYTSFPQTIAFSGLRNKYKYAVRIVAFNEFGDLRAETCLDGIFPNEDTRQVELEDLPLTVRGFYDVRTNVTADAAFETVVDELIQTVKSAKVYDNPAKAVLDNIREILIDQEPNSAEAFDELRETRQLDALLESEFDATDTDVSGAFQGVWDDVKLYLNSFAIASELELGTPEDGVHQISHTVRELLLDEDGDSPIQISCSANIVDDLGNIAYLDDADLDQLVLNAHTIDLALGSPLVDLVRAVIERQFETDDLHQAVISVLDCERIAEVLKPELADVVSSPTVISGCTNSAIEAASKLELAETTLNSTYNQLRLEGSCDLDVPKQGYQVSLLKNGSITLKWISAGEVKLGPLDGVFFATQINKF